MTDVDEVAHTHADLALWEDAHKRASRTREMLAKDKALPAAERAYWQAFATRMERHAAVLGRALTATTINKEGR